LRKLLLRTLIISLVFLTSCSSGFLFNFIEGEDLLSERNFINIAHRGASGHAPEHTMVAYELGKEMHGDFIEIDLQLTADEEIVVFHDDYVDRVTNKSGEVESFTLKQLKQLDVGSWFNKKHPSRASAAFEDLRVVTLEEILDYFGDDLNYYLEIKETENIDLLLKKLYEILHDYDLIERKDRKAQIVIHSFHYEYLLQIHEDEPDIPLVQLIRFRRKANLSNDRINTIKEYAIGIGLNHKRLSRKFVQKIRRSGLLLHPYTVNDKKRMRQIIGWGVTGMSTDFPDRLHEVLEDLKAGR